MGVSAAGDAAARARVEAKVAFLDAIALKSDQSEPGPGEGEPAQRDSPAARKAELLDRLAYTRGETGPEQRREDDGREAPPPVAETSPSPPLRPERLPALAPPAPVETTAHPVDDRGDDREAPRTPMRQEEFWSRYPGEYLPPDQNHPKPDLSGRFESPENRISEVNPHDGREGQANCGECCRAAESNWRGVPTVAGVLAGDGGKGEKGERMELWAGARIRSANFAGIERELADAGSGSSALVVVLWDTNSGHWFNAFNDRGRIVAVDAQNVRIGDWPPTNEKLRFDESVTVRCGAIYFDSDGHPIKE